MEPVDVIEIDPAHYVVDVRLWGRGRRSGAEVDARLAFRYTVRDGLIVRNEFFPDVETALE